MLDFAEQRKAVLSDCGRYRYLLERRVASGQRAVCFVLHNPSTADAERDDPTVRRCCGFARRWGFGRMVIVNLYAWRSSSPADLFAAAAEGVDVVGEKNDGYVGDALVGSELAVAAWGALPGPEKRARLERVVELARAHDRPLHHLGLTRAGDPRHPLYLRRTAEPVPSWEA